MKVKKEKWLLSVHWESSQRNGNTINLSRATFTHPYERNSLALCLIVKKTLETFMLEYFIANTSVSLVVKQNVN